MFRSEKGRGSLVFAEVDAEDARRSEQDAYFPGRETETLLERVASRKGKGEDVESGSGSVLIK